MGWGGGGGVGWWWWGGVVACRIIVSAPVPSPFPFDFGFRILDLYLGPEFWTWILDLDFGLDLGLTI